MDPTQYEQERLDSLNRELPQLSVRRREEEARIAREYDELRRTARARVETEINNIDTNERIQREAIAARIVAEEQRCREQIRQTQRDLDRIKAEETEQQRIDQQERQRANSGAPPSSGGGLFG